MGFGDYLLLALGLCLFLGGLIPVVMRILLRRAGGRTQGTVIRIDSHQDSSGAPFHSCAVEYFVAGKRFVTRGGWSESGKLHFGAERTVYYWPSTPQRGYLDTAMSWIGPMIVSASGVILALTVVNFPLL